MVGDTFGMPLKERMAASRTVVTAQRMSARLEILTGRKAHNHRRSNDTEARPNHNHSGNG